MSGKRQGIFSGLFGWFLLTCFLFFPLVTPEHEHDATDEEEEKEEDAAVFVARYDEIDADTCRHKCNDEPDDFEYFENFTLIH